MNEHIRKYEIETGEKALYRMKSSDYHTLRYVTWIEMKLESDRALLEEAVDGLIEAEQLLRSLGWAERGNKLQAIIARAKERLGCDHESIDVPVYDDKIKFARRKER